MPSSFSHLQINVRPENLAFYADLMNHLAWHTIHVDDEMLGVGDGRCSLWFIANALPVENNYDGPGMNHLGLGVSTQESVDEASRYLSNRDVALLFETPRHRAEFSSADQTYYQIMFESPDRILIEIVYQGPESQ